MWWKLLPMEEIIIQLTSKLAKLSYLIILLLSLDLIPPANLKDF